MTTVAQHINPLGNMSNLPSAAKPMKQGTLLGFIKSRPQKAEEKENATRPEERVPVFVESGSPSSVDSPKVEQSSSDESTPHREASPTQKKPADKKPVVSPAENKAQVKGRKSPTSEDGPAKTRKPRTRKSKYTEDQQLAESKALPACTPVTCAHFGALAMVAEFVAVFKDTMLPSVRKTPDFESLVASVSSRQRNGSALFMDLVIGMLSFVLNQDNGVSDGESDVTTTTHAGPNSQSASTETTDTSDWQKFSRALGCCLEDYPVNGLTANEMVRLYFASVGDRYPNLGLGPVALALVESELWQLPMEHKVGLLQLLVAETMAVPSLHDVITEEVEEADEARRKTWHCKVDRGRMEKEFKQAEADLQAKWEAQRRDFIAMLPKPQDAAAADIVPTDNQAPISAESEPVSEEALEGLAGYSKARAVHEANMARLVKKHEAAMAGITQAESDAHELKQQQERTHGLTQLGVDRYHRQWWAMPAIPEAIFVCTPEGWVSSGPMEKSGPQQSDELDGGDKKEVANDAKEGDGGNVGGNEGTEEVQPEAPAKVEEKPQDDLMEVDGDKNEGAPTEKEAWSFYTLEEAELALSCLNPLGLRESGLLAALGPALARQKDIVASRPTKRRRGPTSLEILTGVAMDAETETSDGWQWGLHVAKELAGVEERVYGGNLGDMQGRDGWLEDIAALPTVTSQQDQLGALQGLLVQLAQCVYVRMLQPPAAYMATAATALGGEASLEDMTPAQRLALAEKWRAQYVAGVLECRNWSALALMLHVLIESVTWDKSAEQAKCSVCRRSNHDDKMLLCDGCDRGFHIFCLKPALARIPAGDWYCTACQTCQQCGKNTGRTGLLRCNKCHAMVHSDCAKTPQARDQWTCQHCTTCKKCNTGGDLVLCLGCGEGGHAECLGLDEDTKQWQCTGCKEINQEAPPAPSKTSSSKRASSSGKSSQPKRAKPAPPPPKAPVSKSGPVGKFSRCLRSNKRRAAAVDANAKRSRMV